jgi:hypothetical protein
MKHNPVSTAHAAGATTGVVFIACRLLVGLFPGWMFSLGQSWFHGIELQKVSNWDLTTGNFFFGLVSAIVSAWLVGYLFAQFYNFFLGKK